MLNVWEAINSRRSIRKFTPEPVPDEKVRQILEAARHAPSAGNSQPWKFMVVRDQNLKRELRRICWNQGFIEEAPVVIVCFGNLERYFEIGDAASRYKRSYSTLPDQDRLNFVIANTVIAIDHMMIMATALGLGTTLVGGFSDSSEFNRLFDLGKNLVPVAIIPLGYAAEEVLPRPRLRLEDILVPRGMQPSFFKNSDKNTV